MVDGRAVESGWVVIKNLIYALRDPRSWEPRYIGKSTTGMDRPKRHRLSSRLATRSHKNSWIKSLLAVGIEYVIEILEQVSTAEKLGVRERFWIARGRAVGWRLTNATDGGDGTPGLVRSPQHRAKVSAALRGRKLTAEHRERIGAAQRGKVLTPECRAKLSLVRTGYRESAATRAKKSASHMGLRHAPDVIVRMAAANTGQKRSLEARANMVVAQQRRRARERGERK